MPIINIVLALIVIGVLMWLVNNYIPMASSIRSILNAVVVIAVVVWVLRVSGVWTELGQYTLPTLTKMTSRRARVFGVTLAVFASLIIVGWSALAILVHRAGPEMRERVVREMDQRFDGTSQLGALSVTVFPRLHVTGDQLSLRRNGDPRARLLFTSNISRSTPILSACCGGLSKSERCI